MIAEGSGIIIVSIIAQLFTSLICTRQVPAQRPVTEFVASPLHHKKL